MAGDWIKLENATPEKPEMIILGRLLGVPREFQLEVALVNFIRVFRWADANVSDGIVPHLSPEDVDSVSGARPGTCAALLNPSIGWLFLENGAICFKDWDKHNGASAKTRCKEMDKKRRQRKCPPIRPDANGTSEGQTKGPENRREENKSSTPKPPPDEWTGVVEELKKFGVVLAEATVNEAKTNGFSTSQILDLLKYLNDPTRKEWYGPGTIVKRIQTPGAAGWAIDYGWPPKSENAMAVHREQSITKQTESQKRKYEQQDEEGKQKKTEREELEAVWGTRLDSLPEEELSDLIGDEQTLKDSTRKHGRESNLVRPLLLSIMAKTFGVISSEITVGRSTCRSAGENGSPILTL